MSRRLFPRKLKFIFLFDLVIKEYSILNNSRNIIRRLECQKSEISVFYALHPIIHSRMETGSARVEEKRQETPE